jgi:hypothetical protein
LAAVAILIVMQACGGNPSPRTGSPARADVIDVQQLQASPYPNAFDAVQALRPQWLRARGRTSINQQEYVRVYLDDSFMGGPEQLRSITLRSISSIRYLDGVAATQRWGLDHGQGAIVVSTRELQKTQKTP